MATELNPEGLRAVKADHGAAKQVKRSVSFCDETRPSSTPSFPIIGHKEFKRAGDQSCRSNTRNNCPAGRSFSASPRGILDTRARASELENDTAWLDTAASGICTETAACVESATKENQIPAGILFRHLLGTNLESSLAFSPNGLTGSTQRKHSYTVMGTKSLKASALHPINVSFFLAQQEEIAAWTPADMPLKARLDRRQSNSTVGIPAADIMVQEEKVIHRKGRQIDGSLTPRGDESRPKRSRKIEYHSRLMAERKREASVLGSKQSMPKRWDVAGAFYATLDQPTGVDAVKLPAVAKCLHCSLDGSCFWRPCVVLGFDVNTSLYLVFWRERDEFRQELSFSLERGMHEEALARLVGGRIMECGAGSYADISISDAVTSIDSAVSSSRSGGEVALHRLVPRLNLHFQHQDRPPSAVENKRRPNSAGSLSGVKGQGLELSKSAVLADDHGTLQKVATALPASRQGARKHGQDSPNQCTRFGHQGFHGINSRLGIAVIDGPQAKVMASRRLVSLPKGTKICDCNEIKEEIIDLGPSDYGVEKCLDENVRRPVVYNLFPVLSEMAEEFKQATENFDAPTCKRGLKGKGPVPVQVPSHSLTDQSAFLVTSMPILRPKLHAAIETVILTSLIVQKTRIFETTCPCLNIERAISMQSETVRERSKTLRKIVLADAKDAFNMAFVEDEGPGVLENGSGLYLRTARWADFVMETALAKALKASLEEYAALFQAGHPLYSMQRRQQPVKPLFVVHLRSSDKTLAFRPALSCLDILSGKLLEDAVKALTLVPFMESKDAMHHKTESLQTYRVSLFAASADTTAACRGKILAGLSPGIEMLEQLAKEISILWANLYIQKEQLELHIRDTAVLKQGDLVLEDLDSSVQGSEVLDMLSELSEGPNFLHVHLRSRTSACALRILERLVKSMGCFVMNQKILQSTLESTNGKAIGSLFLFNCSEILGAVVRLGHDCKRKVTETLHTLLRCKIARLNDQLDNHMSLLATQLFEISPENFAQLEMLVQDYKSKSCTLLSDLDILQGSFYACESLYIELLDTDARSYWSLYGRVQSLLDEAQVKERCLVDAKPAVVAGVRAEQANLLVRASEVIAAIPVYELFRDLASSVEYELQVQMSAEDLRKISAAIQKLQNQEKLLQMFQEGECARLIAPSLDKVEWLAALWITAADWERARKHWLGLQFKQINIDSMSALIQTFLEKVESLVNSSASPSSRQALSALSDQVHWMLARMPLIVRLHHPGVRRMHWLELAKDIGSVEFHGTDDECRFSVVLDLPLLENRQAIVAVLERAAEEYNQEVCLEKMEEEMRRVTLHLSPLSEDQGEIIQGSEHVLELIDDQLVAAGSMLHSPYAKALEGNIRAWREKLYCLLQMLERLLDCQKWMQILKPIFQSANIQQQLTEESSKFAEVNNTWEEVLNLVATRGLFMHLCESSLITENVPKCIVTMEGIMCSLVALLERKRAVFPRFFFLSNDELLQVISHERNPEELQYYLCKCFGDVRRIEFVDNQGEANHCGKAVSLWIRSSEKLFFLNSITTLDRPVEEWMVDIEHEMKETVKDAILAKVKKLLPFNMYLLQENLGAGNCQSLIAEETAEAKSNDLTYAENSTSVYQEEERTVFNCQVLVVAAYVIFCHHMELIISQVEGVAENLKVELLSLEKQLEGLLQKIQSCTSAEQRDTWKSLVLVGLYLRDTVEKLRCEPDVRLESFAWQRVLRYYCHLNGVCRAQVLKIERHYGFDLVDYQNRLVMTPLTERCYLGLMHAFSLGLGGATSGPAAAGKTETVKDLAKALGKHCIVMSCSEEIDHSAMGNALKGMASGGIWLCLDEFQCLRSEVISLLAKQLLIIIQAVQMKAQRFTYEGVGLPLNPTFGICTTMKPMYSIRPECIQNIRSLFRPVSMVEPDMSLIARVLLIAEGLEDAARVARKLTLCFHMAGKQLFFDYHHCDFGLRALKAVIKWMGVLKASADQWFTVSSDACMGDLILCKTLQQYCLPRLVGDGFTLFSNLLLDLFPYLQIPPMKQGGLEASIKVGLAQRRLCPHEPLVEKCLQLHGTMKVHQGVMIVGGSGTGKTQCYTSLAKAFNIMADAESYQDAGLLIKAQVKRDDKTRPLARHVTLEIVNPTAVSTAHLFGSVNSKSHCWQEGIVPHIVQKCETVSRNAGALWMVLDGSMNGQWVDSINTMLDDTGVLFLKNGERIFLPSIERFSVIFEVDTLKGISPAAVSRCGIVLMDPSEPGWRPLVLAWVQMHLVGATFQLFVQELFDGFVPFCLAAIAGCQSLPTSDVGLVQNLLNVLESILRGLSHGLGSVDGVAVLNVGGSLRDGTRGLSSCGKGVARNPKMHGTLSSNQKQIRDVVNWRRLYHESSWFSTSENVSMEREIDSMADRNSQEGDGEPFLQGQDFGADALPVSLDALQTIKASVGSLFIFSLVWSVGGLLTDLENRERFDKVVRDCASAYPYICELLPEGPIFDFFFDTGARIWKGWIDLLSDKISQVGKGISLLSRAGDLVRNGSHFTLSLGDEVLYVPTQETVRYEMLASCVCERGRPVLLSGVPGSGKTMIASYLLHQLKAIKNHQVVAVTLHGTSSGRTLYHDVRPKLAIQKRRMLTPGIHEKLALFIDDLNVVQHSVQGEAPAQQFIRFLIEQQGWYGYPADAAFTAVHGLVHLASMTMQVPLGLPVARLLRHYFLIHVAEYSECSMASIFSTAIANKYPDLSCNVVTGLLLNNISEASVKLFSQLRTTFQSLTDRFSLGLHDIFRVLKRLVSASLGSFTENDGIFRVWANEFCRAVCDGLKIPADRGLVVSALSAVAKEKLIPETDDQLQFLESLVSEQRQPIFGMYYRVVQPDTVIQAWSQYEEVVDRKKWAESMQKFLVSYSMEEGYKNALVLFPEALTHLSRVLRMLQVADGHALLLGCSGSGRSSMTRLATHVLGYVLHEVQVNSDYDYQTWRMMLKDLLKSSSLRDTHTVLLVKMEVEFEVQRKIMQDLNHIVHCGEAWELLGDDEKYYVQQELHRLQEGTMIQSFELEVGSDREHFLKLCFLQRLKEKLHLVICAGSSSGTEAGQSNICASALIASHFSVDYYDRWTPGALQAVARVKLTEHDIVKAIPHSCLENLVNSCSELHNICNALASESAMGKGSSTFIRQGYVWQKGSWRLVGLASYHEMLHVFGLTLGKKGGELDSYLDRLEIGVKKLKSTRNLVLQMQQDLREILNCKEHTSSDMDQLLSSINGEQIAIDKALQAVYDEEKLAVEEAELCKKLAKAAQEQVEEVAPQVSAAIKQLSLLNKKDVSELKSFTQPPPRLLIVLEALCIILQKKPKRRRAVFPHEVLKLENPDDYWPVARELLSQVNFVQLLLNFNKDGMESATMEKLRPYMENPLFKPEKVRRISVACRSICIWIRAMYKYHVAKTIKMEPRLEKLKVANENLESCKAKLEEKRLHLATIEESLFHLKARYENASLTKGSLVRKAEDSELKLQRAIRLITRLDGECRRWAEQVDDLRKRRESLMGDALLAAGYVAYLGAFPASVRSAIVTKWQNSFTRIGLLYSKDFSLVTFCSSPQDIKTWVASGLPPDTHSLENAIIVCNSSRPALLLDPQKQASNWICTLEDPYGVQTVNANSDNLLEEVESCIVADGLLLVENVGSSTPPGLLHRITTLRKIKSSNHTHLGPPKQQCKQSSTCRCIFLTSEAGFKCSDEAGISLNIVDFSITFHGLCSQLLCIAAERERQDLEEERNRLLHQRLALNCRLHEVENQILTLLQGAMGTILDNEALEQALSDAAATYADIQARMKKAGSTENAIEQIRRRYKPIAERATILYSCIADVAKLESIYMWTLPWFKNAYSTSMQRTSSLNPVELETRLMYLINKVTTAIYKRVSSSLLRKHRLLFGLLVAFRITQRRQDVTQEEWMFLLRGNTEAPPMYCDEKCPPWLKATSQEWRQLCHLSNLPSFEGLIEDLKTKAWKEFHLSDRCLPLPAFWRRKLGSFRALLVLRCLRLDRLAEAIQSLVTEVLSLGDEDERLLTVEDAYEESNLNIPITCIHQDVSAPVEEILSFAKRHSMLRKLWVFSLDHCQEPKVVDAIKEAAQWGKWVLLQNCHADLCFMRKLEVVFEDLKQGTVQSSFRLWLTTQPVKACPSTLLINCVRIVLEPPKGVKSKVLKILMSQQAEEEYCAQRKMRKEGRNVQHSRAIFQLALFHSLVQERGSFGCLGWNNAFPIDLNDFNLAKAQLEDLSEDSQLAEQAHVNSIARIKISEGENAARKNSKTDKSAVGIEDTSTMSLLKTMTTQIIYGGYVVDSWDQHCMAKLYDRCFATKDEYSNWESVMRMYLPKDSGTLEDFINHTQQLPDSDDPEVMGLPKDAVIGQAQGEAQELLSLALSLECHENSFIEPFATTFGFEDKNGTALKSLQDIARTVHHSLPEEELRSNLQNSEDPFLMILLEEVKHYNRLIQVVRDSVIQAQRAILRPEEMSLSVEAVCNSILAGQVPDSWMSFSYPSLKPLASWVDDFSKRLDFIKGWIDFGTPKVIWISGLFYPQAVFAATVQQHARVHGVPLDTVHLHVGLVDYQAQMEYPSEGYYITGLFLEGAQWDPQQQCLALTDPMQSLTKMCDIWLRPSSSPLPTQIAVTEEIYSCPIYRNQARNGRRQSLESCVGTVDLPAGKKEAKFWVLRGVALICSTRD